MKGILFLIPFLLLSLGCEKREEEVQDLDMMVQEERDVTSELAEHEPNDPPKESTQETLM